MSTTWSYVYVTYPILYLIIIKACLSKMRIDTYVSMYVDSQTQEIILSLNPNLTKEEIYSMGSYGEPDDNTFH